MENKSGELEEFRKTFKRIMFEYEISTKKLSSLSGVSEQQISNYRTGNRAPSLETFLILVKSLPVQAQIDCLDLLFNLKDKIDISRKQPDSTEFNYKDPPKKTLKVAESKREYKV